MIRIYRITKKSHQAHTSYLVSRWMKVCISRPLMIFYHQLHEEHKLYFSAKLTKKVPKTKSSIDDQQREQIRKLQKVPDNLLEIVDEVLRVWYLIPSKTQWDSIVEESRGQFHRNVGLHQREAAIDSQFGTAVHSL